MHSRYTDDNHNSLNQELLDLVADGVDLRLDLRVLVRQDGAGDDRPGHTAGTSESNLGGDEDIGHVLILAQQRQVQEDLERLSVGGHDDQVGDAAIQGLGGLVGALLQLLHVAALLHCV